MNKRITKLIALSLALVMFLLCFTGFTRAEGFGSIYRAEHYDIYENADYTRYFGEHSSNGIETANVITADTENTNLEVIVLNGEVRATSTVGSMVDYAEKQGYKVVAAMNGDIYDTNSGTPKNLVIHNGNIVTGGYASDRVIAFDDKGRATLEPAKLSYSLAGTIEYQMPVTSSSSVSVPVETIVTVTEAAIDENGAEYIRETTQSSIVYEEQSVSETVYETVTKDQELKIGFFNVPHGGANSLHLYNRHYATSTKTTGVNAEAVISVDDIQLQVNKTIKGTVKNVNPSTANTAIGDNEMVLSTVKDSETYNYICALKPGSEIEITVSDPNNSGLKNAKEAIGIYYSLVENGKNVTVGATLNPRTLLGMKKDGSILMAEIDGRQSAVSKGLGLADAANFMIDQGCDIAVNLDGGGSSVMYVRRAGIDAKATRVSSPSEGSERKVANVVLLVYKDKNSQSAVKHMHVVPSNVLAMPGAMVSLSAYASNADYEKVNFNGNPVFSASKGNGEINGNIYTAPNLTGKYEVKVSGNGLTGTNFVTVVNDIIIKPSVSKLSLSAGESKDINITAGYGSAAVNAAVACSDELFSWSCDEAIGTIDQSGVFTAASSMQAQSGNIYVSYGSNTKKISVQVGAALVEFADTVDHWAKEYIGSLAGLGYLSGMGENKFEPNTELTRAQFIAMLAKIDAGINPGNALDITNKEQIANMKAISEVNFTDVDDSDWFSPYVYWGVDCGITNGMGDGTFAPETPITREQMSVMLCKYAISLGFALPQEQMVPSFTDAGTISSWAIDYVNTAAGAGILSGFETGEFGPQGLATRAQAAKVIYVFGKLKGLL